jgi:hypothetical protein
LSVRYRTALRHCGYQKRHLGPASWSAWLTRHLELARSLTRGFTRSCRTATRSTGIFAVDGPLDLKEFVDPTHCLGGDRCGFSAPTTQHDGEWLVRVKGCRCGYVGSTSGVPEIADDLSRRSTRPPWANYGSRGASHALRKFV